LDGEGTLIYPNYFHGERDWDPRRHIYAVIGSSGLNTVLCALKPPLFSMEHAESILF